MPTVRLEFELDSEVYPELHAALTSLRSTRARAERLRQLAATGLVWEKVRIHGATMGAPVTEERRGLVTRADVVAAPAAPDGEPLPAAPKRARPSPSPKRRASDVVDLAINAEPMPVPELRPDRRGVAPSRRDVEQAIRELPVLMDVVTDLNVNVVPDVSPLNGHDDHRAHTPDLSEPAAWASMNAYPDDVPALSSDQADDDTEGPPEPPLHVTALSHKPATRSRLMRMKERGLFKNG
jgi:hypothetical protein